MELFDFHCHIDLMPSMINFARDVAKTNINVLTVTTTPKAFEKEIEILKQFSNIKVGLGLHPQLVSSRYRELSLVKELITCADYIGEIGLDFNRQFYFSKEKQIEVFENIIKWCSEIGGKVISIHSVRSDKTVLDILEKYKCIEKNKCILHWFSGTQIQLRRALQMGCFFSVNGAMMESLNGQKLIKLISPNRLLLETDAPFVNEVQTVPLLKGELEKIVTYLSLTYGEDIIDAIQGTSKSLLSIF